ncbi:MAG: methyl-accepting chemotaxis protein [Methylococcaceae bacterium]|jgi:methyl-accepting chemotaxis protein
MLTQLSLKARLTIIVATLMAGFTLFGAGAFYALKTLNINGPVYQQISQSKDLVADILPPPEYIIEPYLVVLQLSINSDPEEIEALSKRFKALHNNYNNRHQFWQDQGLDPELTKLLLQQSYQSAQRFFDTVEQQFLPNLIAGNTTEVTLALEQIHKSYAEHRTAIDETVKIASAHINLNEANAAQQIKTLYTGLIAVFAASLTLALMLTGIISRSILRQLGGEPSYATEIAQKMAHGNLNNHIVVDATNPTSLLSNIKNMQQQLRERIDNEVTEKANMMRIKMALDNANTNAVIIDANFDIIYINHSAINMLRQCQANILKILPHFNVDTLIGTNIDQYHKNPAHQRLILAQINKTFQTQIAVADLTFELIINPVINAQKEQIGFVVEWLNKTLDIAAELEVSAIIDAANAGNFNQYINVNDKVGSLLSLSLGINHLAETTEHSLQDIARVLEAMSEGDLTEGINDDYQGLFGQLKEDTNLTVANLTKLVIEIKTAGDAIATAAQEIATGITDLSQRTEQQASSLQQTASSMVQLSSTVKQNADNAKNANQMALSASEVAFKGGLAVKEVVGTMNAINDSAEKIVNIISVIDEIAFQTNILALNAAVEAARAGDQGRGFAVVASEVRNLAQRSSAAASEIKVLIQDSVDKVETGSKLVHHAGATITDVVSSVQRVTTIMAQIAEASAQQSQGIDQVNQAISQMDVVTQQNAALVEQASAAAESLTEQAEGLAYSVSRFKTNYSTNPVQITSQPTKPKAPTNPVKQEKITANIGKDDWDEF